MLGSLSPNGIDQPNNPTPLCGPAHVLQPHRSTGDNCASHAKLLREQPRAPTTL